VESDVSFIESEYSQAWTYRSNWIGTPTRYRNWKVDSADSNCFEWFGL